jgi:flagellar biosynthesis GTPase FlhF
VLDFDDVQQKLSTLTSIVSHLPEVPLLCNVNVLRRHVHNCQANKDNKEAFKERLAALREELEEVKRRLALAREQEQLSMQDDPQEILNNKLRDPETVLTPNQSISLIDYCTELGEKNAAHAAEKTVSIFLGNTGAGKSTTINALLRMPDEGSET